MKKFLLAGFCGLVMLLMMVHDSTLLSRLRWLEAPQMHKVQKGESLSKLAKAYYGEVDYWRELALVNRAPNPNHIEPEEEILLPAASVIANLRKARTITSVNTLVEQQHLLAKKASGDGSTSPKPAVTATPTRGPALEANQTPAPAPVVAQEQPPPEPVAAQPQPESSGGLSWFWLILSLMLLGGVVAFMLYRRRQEEQAAKEQEEQEGVYRRRPVPDYETADSAEKRQNFPNDRQSIILRKNSAVDTTA